MLPKYIVCTPEQAPEASRLIELLKKEDAMDNKNADWTQLPARMQYYRDMAQSMGLNQCLSERCPVSVQPPPLSRWTRFRMWLAGVIWPEGGY